MKQIVGCKRNQWRLDASIMRLGVVGRLVPPVGKGGRGGSKECFFEIFVICEGLSLDFRAQTFF